MDITPAEFVAFYHDSGLNVYEIGDLIGCHPDKLSTVARRLGVKTRQELGIRVKNNRVAALKPWRPCRCESCELVRECEAVCADETLVGVGCEVVGLDDRPDRYEEDGVIYYRSVNIEMMVVVGDLS